MEATIETVHQDLEVLKKAVFKIQEHMEDCFLTAEEEARLDQSLKERTEGKTFSLEDIKRDRE